MSAKEILITDFGRCRPASGIRELPERGKWVVYPYETPEFTGRMITAAAFENPPDLTLDLNARDLFDIYIGIHYGLGGLHQSGQICAGSPSIYCLWLKLSGDRCFDRIDPELYPDRWGAHPEKTIRWDSLAEVHWRRADLTDQALVISPPREETLSLAYASIAYVRLVPVAESDRWTREKRLVGIFDGAFLGDYPRSREDIRSWLEPFRESDFSLMLWPTCRFDACDYPTAVGQVRTGCTGACYPAYYPHYVSRDLRYLLDHGIDPLATAVEICREMDMAIYGSMRFSGQRLPPQHFPLSRPNFFADRRDLWVRTETNEPAPHLSLAYPEVRDRVVAIFREQVERYDLDGVHFIFTRSHPFVGCEEPSARDFFNRYGVDIHTVDRRDVRLCEHKAGYVTDLVRSIRRMLDEVQAGKNRPLGLALHVFNSLNHCRFFGLDVAAWLREDLVRHLIVFPTHSGAAFEETAVTHDNLRQFTELARGTSCRVYPDFYPRLLPPDKYRLKAMDYYQAGADGICFWDSYQRLNRKSEWSMVRRLGHKDELANWEALAKGLYRFVPLKSVAGLLMDPYYGPSTHG